MPRSWCHYSPNRYRTVSQLAEDRLMTWFLGQLWPKDQQNLIFTRAQWRATPRQTQNLPRKHQPFGPCLHQCRRHLRRRYLPAMRPPGKELCRTCNISFVGSGRRRRMFQRAVVCRVGRKDTSTAGSAYAYATVTLGEYLAFVSAACLSLIYVGQFMGPIYQLIHCNLYNKYLLILFLFSSYFRFSISCGKKLGWQNSGLGECRAWPWSSMVFILDGTGTVSRWTYHNQ